MSWFALRVESAHQREGIIAALIDAGGPGVHEDGTALVSYYESTSAARSAAATVVRMTPDATVQIEPVVDADWTTTWRLQMRAFSVDALTIAPPWLAGGLNPERSVIIDPGMAFGTGDHASTRGAMKLMQRAIRPGDTVADLGTGSAVLAIAAAKLGARRVTGLEIDIDAMGNARENVQRNGVQSVVHLLEGDAAVVLPLIAPVDVILANITARILGALLPAMSVAAPRGGRAVVAGILEVESTGFLNAARTHGWSQQQVSREEDWWSALLERQ